VKLTI